MEDPLIEVEEEECPSSMETRKINCDADLFNSNNSNIDSDNPQHNQNINLINKTSKWQENKKKYEFEGEYNSEPKSKFKFIEKSPKERFGRFEEEIGKGTFKRVYRAYDFDEGREVAWSIVSTLDISQKELDQIYDEINLLKKIKNPHIIQYVSGWYDCEKNRLNIISELFTGGSLNQ